MNTRMLSFLALAASVTLPIAAHASARPASKYLYLSILPLGAIDADSGGRPYPIDGNPINSDGVVAAQASFGQACGDNRAFVYFPKTQRYVLLDQPPGLGAADTDVVGIADDNSVLGYAAPCSTKQTLVYRVAMAGTTPHWSQPCACPGYLAGYTFPQSPVGYNSDGAGLINSKLGPAVLSFPDGAPKISPLATNVGVRAKARMTAAGTPSGFVGTQYTPKNHYVPTVWLDGKVYRLPVAEPSSQRPVPFGMAERQTAHGLRVDIVGTIWYRTSRYGPGWGGTDYWLGKPASNGFKFVEKRRFIRSRDMGTAYGISADGSMIFGLSVYDGEGLAIYFTPSRKTILGGYGCGGGDGGEGWGDGRGDILVNAYYSGPSTGFCLAEREQ